MKYSLLNDSELLTLMKDQESEAAFREIYQRHWKKIFLLAYKKVRSKELAEELTQNIFVSLWERKAEVKILNLRHWLSGALKFSIINHYKAQVVHEKYVAHSLNVIPKASHTTEHLIFLKDLSEAIEKGTSLLPEKTQQVFQLSRLQHRTVKEISKAMNISEKAVEYHITQSLKVMRVHLKEYMLLALLLIIIIF